jgi:hypothetical protein
MQKERLAKLAPPEESGNQVLELIIITAYFGYRGATRK